MKTKTISNALFGLMMGAFLFALFMVMPAQPTQAEQPALKLEKKAVPPATELSAPVPAEAAEVDSLSPAPADVPPSAPAGPVVVDMEWLLNKENAIASLVMLLLAFFSKWVPGLSAIGDTGKRALVSGLTVIVGFLAVKFFGPGDVSWSGLASLGVTYLLTSLGYDKTLKPIGIHTPKVAKA